MPDFPTIKDLEKARQKKGITIYALCRTANIAESLYHRWKRGTVEPTIASLKRAYEGLERSK